MRASLLQAFVREFLRYFRRQHEWLLPFLFFNLVLIVFPLVLPINKTLLSQVGVGAIWVVLFLAVLLSLPNVLQADFEDGSLEVHLLNSLPLSLLMLVKVMVHWLVVSVPLIIFTPMMALFYSFSWQQVFYLELSLLVGTPIIHLLGLFVAALTIGLRQKELIMVLVLVPIALPTLIFACGAVLQVETMPFLWLGAMLSLSLSTMPWLSACALRLNEGAA